jgi:hypothetical protein
VVAVIANMLAAVVAKAVAHIDVMVVVKAILLRFLKNKDAMEFALIF